MKKPPESKQSSGTYPANVDDLDARRKTVKKVLAGAGIVGAVQYWTKPVVEAVVLPTHAGTSAPPSPPRASSPPPPPPPDGPKGD